MGLKSKIGVIIIISFSVVLYVLFFIISIACKLLNLLIMDYVKL